MENQIVVFELDKEQYGVNIAGVEAISKMQSITKMPHAPAFVEGITNLRGKVLPVIDLRRRFNLPSQPAGKESRIVVIPMAGAEVGIMVDGVSEVFTIQDTDIEPTPCLATTVDSDFITGIAKLNGRLVILLDYFQYMKNPRWKLFPQRSDT
jgi:purine-binding chemotaxis protein CheW